MSDLSRLRIVEIGHLPLIKQAFPGQVAFFSTWTNGTQATANERDGVDWLPSLRALWRTLRAPETSLVVCHPLHYSPWHWQSVSRALFNRRAASRLTLFPRLFGPQMLRGQTSAPVVIVDFIDLPLIDRNTYFLLDRCSLYFKRELPPDRWRLFMKTGHANLPTPRFRKSKRYLARIDKLRPVSVGVPLSEPSSFPVPGGEKSTDIFFAGTIEGSSSIRKQGLCELQALRERGFVIDLPERRLPPSEFYRRCAQAWLTWSPEGLGWDCFRHYEAAASGSVPLINQPTIERYQPLRAGEHAVYYEVEQGDLMRAAVSALADRPRLAAMGRAARSHVLAHHTPAAIARYIVRTSIDTATRSQQAVSHSAILQAAGETAADVTADRQAAEF